MAARAIVHVGSACRDVAAGRSARLAARRRRDLRRADDAPGSACGPRRSSASTPRPHAPTSSTLMRDAGVDLLLRAPGRGPDLPQRRDARRVGSRPASSPACRCRSRTCPRPGRRPGLAARAGRRRDPRRLGRGAPRRRLSSASPGRASSGRCVAGERVARRRAGGRRRSWRRADLVGVSHRDVAPDTPLAAPDRAAPARAPGSLVTRGAEGGLVVDRRWPADRSGRSATADPRIARSTRPGRGHVFLAALHLDGRPSHAGRASPGPGTSRDPVRRRGRRLVVEGARPGRGPGPGGDPGPNGPRRRPQARRAGRRRSGG